MVKGVSRQIIMVESTDPSIFEKAIFIIRDGERGASREELLREAQLIAENYLRGGKPRRGKKAMPVVYAVIGALLACAVWLLAGAV